MKKFIVFLVALVALSTIFICGCTTEKALSFTDLTHFGSVLKADLYCSQTEFEKFGDYAKRTLSALSEAFDTSLGGSDAAKINAAKTGEKVKISDLTKEAFDVSLVAYELTDGFYDPTVAPLVDLWGFSSRIRNGGEKKPYDRTANADGSYPLPDEKYIKAFRSLVGLKKFVLSEENGEYFVTKTASGVEADGVTYYAQIDFSALAKGLAVEKLTKFCNENGITRGYISYGSSSIGLLKNQKGKEWDFLLTNPRRDGTETTNRDRTYCSMKKSDVQASTSGDYERCYFLAGRRYSHIIDAASGMPSDNGVAAVTVIGARGSLADCLSTGLIAAGKEKVIEFARSEYAVKNGITVVAAFIENGGIKVFTTENGLKITKGSAYDG